MPQDPLSTTLAVPPPPAMASAAAPARFTVGGVIGRSLRVWWRHVLSFGVMGLVVAAPIVAFFSILIAKAFALDAAGAKLGPEAFRGYAGIGSAVLVFAVLLTAVLAVVQMGAVTHATFQDLRGGRVRLGEMVAIGLRRGSPVAGAGLVMGLGITLASFLLVVPGVMLACAWAVAIPAVVVEGIGPGRALARSAALTRGERWIVFAALLVLFVVVWLFSALVQIVTVVLSPLFLPAGLAPLAVLLVSPLASALSSPLLTVALAVAYHDLRASKEGLDSAQLATVFE